MNSGREKREGGPGEGGPGEGGDVRICVNYLEGLSEWMYHYDETDAYRVICVYPLGWDEHSLFFCHPVIGAAGW